MKNNALVIGSRGSDLALWQARWVESEIRKADPRSEVAIEVIRTTGDRVLDSPLSAIGDRGLFTREIEEALLARRIDCAVHSLKDLPTELPGGLTVGAVCVREDIRDVFIPHPDNPVRTLLDQRQGVEIATGSLRRRSQLLARRPDFRIVDIRGNLNTRMNKLKESTWAGMILACAGVRRLGWEESIGEIIPVEILLPAVGQGAIAVEIRQGDARVSSMLAGLDDPGTACAVRAERALLRALEGGCQIPIGAYGRIEDTGSGEELHLDGLVASLDGRTVVRGKTHGRASGAEEIGRALGETLLEGGADRILREIRNETRSQ
ncbi:MAG TPA: hydroxymethylbilane synthase [Bacteroidota bacterium]|nr:hydroxymethylbilane synthase [Bacteroidota bacterium]